MSATQDIQRLVFAVMDANDTAVREGRPGANDVYVIPARLWFAVQDALRPSLTRDRPVASNTGTEQK